MKPIHIIQPPISQNVPIKQQKPIQNNSSFANMLSEAQQTVKISKHASQRMAQRNIEISPTEWQKIDDQLQVAKNKGLKESLFLTQNAALIINIKNQTVVTALDRQEASNQVFTNIDGAIIL